MRKLLSVLLLLPVLAFAKGGPDYFAPASFSKKKRDLDSLAFNINYDPFESVLSLIPSSSIFYTGLFGYYILDKNEDETPKLSLQVAMPIVSAGNFGNTIRGAIGAPAYVDEYYAQQEEQLHRLHRRDPLSGRAEICRARPGCGNGRQRGRSADGRRREHGAAGLQGHHRAGAVRGCRDHHARSDHPAHHRRI